MERSGLDNYLVKLQVIYGNGRIYKAYGDKLFVPSKGCFVDLFVLFFIMVLVQEISDSI